MKKVLISFLSFIFILQSCSSGDDGDSNNSSSTFLKIYDGKTWMWEDDHGYIEYYKFNNSTKNPFTLYHSGDYLTPPACLMVINTISLGQFNITENSTNKLVLQIGSSAGYSFYTFELKSGVMTLTVVQYRNNQIVDVDNIVLIQESINKKNIPICN